MFLRYLEPLAAPFKAIRNRWVGMKNVQGRLRVDVGRVKSYKQLAKIRAKEAKQMASNAKNKAGAAGGRLSGGPPGAPGQLGPGQFMPPGAMPAGAMAGGGMQGGGMQGGGMQGGGMQGGGMQGGGMHSGYPAGGAMAYQGPMSGGGPPPGGPPGYPPPGGPPGHPAPGGGPGFPGGPGPQGYPPGGPPMNGGIAVTGMLWWKKHLCVQCGQQLDKTWDRCPYCTQGAPIAASHKTQAIMLDAAGAGSGLKLCGWLVGLKGPQRGELFTLEPVSSIGTDPGCTIVLGDSYMSSRHCEIRAEGGSWVLRDLRSTNGTYVNDKRIEQHELVDSDFIKLGQSVVKFKSL